MAQEDKFKHAIVSKIAQRAGNHCSNPACNALTTGPAADPSASVNVGQAAHIYGANPGSARYDEKMQSAQRSDITNAIWLCGNCHKLIDSDPLRYPAGLLFEWQKEHERTIADAIGKPGAEIRKRYEDRHLQELGKLSYLAQRIVIDKDDGWEYKLTAEVLRFEMTPVLKRWGSLKRGLYLKPHTRISKEEYIQWILSKLNEIQAICHAFTELANIEFAAAWGDPGVAGSDEAIIDTCRLYSEMCKSALEWEESVRFASTPSLFDDIQRLFIGVAGGIIDETSKLPLFISDLLENEHSSGTHHLQMVLDLPDGWSEAVNQAIERAAAQLFAES